MEAEDAMAKKTWEVILIILGIATELVILIKDKLKKGGKDGNGSGTAKTQQ
jgi:hypothetical protein